MTECPCQLRTGLQCAVVDIVSCGRESLQKSSDFVFT